jgi:hypothetical protein
MIIILRFTILSLFNYGVFISSPYIDTFQLLKDLEIFFKVDSSDIYLTYMISSIFVAGVTILLISIFKPFIEIYLLHYSRYFFYILVCLLGLSSVYIILRIYGYSRISLFIYILLSSTFLNFSNRLLKILK